MPGTLIQNYSHRVGAASDGLIGVKTEVYPGPHRIYVNSGSLK